MRAASVALAVAALSLTTASAQLAPCLASRASMAGAQIVNGETPFFEGHLGESLLALRAKAFGLLEDREDGHWRAHSAGEHPLGQAAFAARTVLRAARLTGHLELRRQALDCLKQLEQYAVSGCALPWAYPHCEPEVLSAAHAISAYMDAFEITGDRKYIAQAVYWAKTGHRLVCLTSLDVTSGLVYAYALQDLAPYDNSFDWRTIAQGITNSAMHQQYTDGPSKGCYPDSWNVIAATPNPADINLNECRLRGNGAQIRTARVPARVGEALVNSVFDIEAVLGQVGEGKLGLMLRGASGFAAHTVVVPAQEPQSVDGAGARAVDSAALAKLPTGWLYDRAAQALVLKHTPATPAFRVEVTW